jgi:hypothetical protein
MSISHFIKPYEKIKCINKLKLPLEICSVIKEFIFYDKNSLHFIKKLTTEKKELDAINKAWSRNNLIVSLWRPQNVLYTEKSSRWSFRLSNYEWHPSRSQSLLGENCVKCGEFIYVSYKYKPDIHINYNLCLC